MKRVQEDCIVTQGQGDNHVSITLVLTVKQHPNASDNSIQLAAFLDWKDPARLHLLHEISTGHKETKQTQKENTDHLGTAPLTPKTAFIVENIKSGSIHKKKLQGYFKKKFPFVYWRFASSSRPVPQNLNFRKINTGLMLSSSSS